MKKKWIALLAGILFCASIRGVSAEAGLPEESPAGVVVEAEAEPQATDEKYFVFDEEEGRISYYEREGPNDVVIPAKIRGVQVKIIGKSAFREHGLTSVQLPEGLEVIEKGAFEKNSLKKVVIPSSVERIETYAFAENQLTEAELPDGLKYLRSFAFFKNQLTSVHLPKNLFWIEIGAFMKNKLTSVEIPVGVKKIGKFAFLNNQLTEVSLPEGLFEIDVEAFAYNPLTSIQIPKEVRYIRRAAFFETSLTEVSLHPDCSLETLSFDENVQLKWGALTESDFFFEPATGKVTGYKGESLPEVLYIPDAIAGKKVTVIGKDAFRNRWTRMVVVGENTEKIESGAFYGSDAIVIELPSSLKVIESKAFLKTFDRNMMVAKGCQVAEDAFDEDDEITTLFPDVHKFKPELVVRFDKEIQAIDEKYISAMDPLGGTVLFRIDVIDRKNIKFILTNGPFVDLVPGEKYSFFLKKGIKAVDGSTLKRDVIVYFVYADSMIPFR